MSEWSPHATYSTSADALYVYLSESTVTRTHVLDDRRIVDLAADGSVIGLEFIDASAGVDLTGLPLSQQVRRQVAELIRDFRLPVFA